MQPTKAWPLAAVAICCAALAWLVALLTFAKLPPLPWTAVPALLLLAFGELMFARNLRMRLQGSRESPGAAPQGRPGVKPVDPMAVPRVVALAKASSMAAAAFGGLAAGFCIYTLSSLDKAVPRHDALVSAITVASALALVAAALYLERCCRAPEPPDDEDDLPRQNGQHGRSR